MTEPTPGPGRDSRGSGTQPGSGQGPARPRQVTLAATLIIAGSVFIVLSVYEQIAGIHTIEARESAERFLSTPPGDGLGLQVDNVLLILRTLAMVAGGCATAAAILGGYVLRRNRGARIGLSVLAVPLFLSGMATGGFMSSVVVAAAVMLWFQPARDWFDGITRATPPPLARETSDGGSTRAVWPPPYTPPADTPGQAGPRAYPGFGTPPTDPADPANPSAPAQPGPPSAAWPAPDAGQRMTTWGPPTSDPTSDPMRAPMGAAVGSRRPAGLVWACALTWASCALAGMGMLASALVLATSPDLVFDELNRANPEFADQGISNAAITNATYVVAAIAVTWCVAAVVFAAFAWRRTPWARIALLASASVATVILLVATVANFLLVLPLLACAASVFLLMRPEVRAWFVAPR